MQHVGNEKFLYPYKTVGRNKSPFVSQKYVLSTEVDGSILHPHLLGTDGRCGSSKPVECWGSCSNLDGSPVDHHSAVCSSKADFIIIGLNNSS